jgi:hypothetical protein
MTIIDKRHGGPYDRGGADYYYHRSYQPHYFEGETAFSRRVPSEEMTPEELRSYARGWNDAENEGLIKDYGIEERDE